MTLDETVEKILALVESGEFRCTADWYMESVEDEPQPKVLQQGEVFSEVECLPIKPWRERIDPEHLKWYDERGRCKNHLWVEIQREYGEAGSILSSYPVVSGDCAEVHGYADGESGLYDELVTRYGERQRLAKAIRHMLSLRTTSESTA